MQGVTVVKNEDYAVTVLNCSPAMAKGYVHTSNRFQRPIAKKNVLTYTQCMIRGTWKVTPSAPIAISNQGRVVDGNHRLHAVIESGMTVPMAFLFNAPEESFDCLDRGRRRDLSQIAKLSGKNHSDGRAVASCHSLTWTVGRVASIIDKFDVDDLMTVLDRYDSQLGVAFSTSGTHMNSASFRGAVLRAAISRPAAINDIADFAKIAATGLTEQVSTSLDTSIPLAVRKHALDHPSRGGGSQAYERWIVTLRGLKYYLNRSSVTYKTVSNWKLEKSQPFPTLLDSRPKDKTLSEYLDS
jgi:hypothetical protein